MLPGSSGVINNHRQVVPGLVTLRCKGPMSKFCNERVLLSNAGQPFSAISMENRIKSQSISTEYYVDRDPAQPATIQSVLGCKA